MVGESLLLQVFLFINISSVEHRGLFHQAFRHFPVGHAELLPLGDEHQGVGIDQGVVGVLGVVDGVAQPPAGFVHGDGVVGLHRGAGMEQLVDEHERGGLAHVVGLGLERKAPEGDGLAAQVTLVMAAELVEEDFFLPLVDRLHGLEHLQVVSRFLCRLHQRLHVFGETAAAVSATGIEELGADARIAADAAAHHVHVGAHQLAEVGDVVHEADAGGQHGVGGILDHLGRGDVGEDHPVVVEHERLVEPRHQLPCTVGLHAHHHPVGAHEIVHRVAFLQELGVGGHVEPDIGHAPLIEFLADALLHLLGGAHRHGAFGHHQRVAVDVSADGARHLQHILQVGAAVLVGGSSHGAEHHLHLVEHRAQVGGETEPSGLVVADHHLFQSRFINRDDALFQFLYLVRVDVDAMHFGAHFREAGSCDQAHVTGANNRYFHKKDSNYKFKRTAWFLFLRRSVQTHAYINLLMCPRLA